MADFLGLMKQAAELKSKMETMQAQLDQVEVEGTSGGGLVSVKLSGKGEMPLAPPPDDAGDGPELASDDGRSGFDDDGRPADAEDDH